MTPSVERETDALRRDALRVELFGGLRVRRPDGGPVPLPGGVAADLFAWLALQKGRPQPREQLMERFWPSDEIESAQRKLRQSLWLIRQALSEAREEGAGMLASDRSTVCLSSGAVSTDVADFENGVTASGDEASQAAGLASAVSLYQGELLPGAYQDCFAVERRRLEAQLRAALLRLADLHARTGEIDVAVQAAHRYVELDPLDETGHGLLMRLFAESGRVGEVRRQYELLEETLRRETGDAPSAATRELLDRLTALGAGRMAERMASLEPARAASAQRETAKAPRVSEPAAPAAVGIRDAPTSGGAGRRAPLPAGITALAVVAALAAPLFVRPHRPAPPALPGGVPSLRLASASIYPPASGEKPNSEPTALAPDGADGVYLCGFTQTEKEDVDILVQRYRPDGSLQWSSRYGSPGHDCDRAYAVVASTTTLFVAGESFVPGKGGTPDAWRHILLRYSHDGHLLWVQRHPLPLSEKGERAISCTGDGMQGVYLSGTVMEASRAGGMVARYDAFGRLLWTKTIHPDGAARAEVSGLRDWGDAVYAGGTAYPRAGDDRSPFAFVCCYGRDGTLRWMKSSKGEAHPQRLARLVVDNSGGVYTVAVSQAGEPASGGGNILSVSRYLPDGLRAWTQECRESGPD